MGTKKTSREGFALQFVLQKAGVLHDLRYKITYLLSLQNA
jgi:hypothetical protein